MSPLDKVTPVFDIVPVVKDDALINVSEVLKKSGVLYSIIEIKERA